MIAEHGLSVENPLVAQIEHIGDLLRENPRLGRRIDLRSRLQGEVRLVLLRSSWHLYYRFVPERRAYVGGRAKPA